MFTREKSDGLAEKKTVLVVCQLYDGNDRR